MKTEITAKEYVNIYEACNWDPKAFSIVLKRFGYSDELIVDDDLILGETHIQSLGNLKTVGGYLNLGWTPIQDLGKLEYVGLSLWLEGTPIQSLGNLKTVGYDLWLEGTPIQSLGNLKTVGGSLFLRETPISKKYSVKEIRKIVKVVNGVFLR